MPCAGFAQIIVDNDQARVKDGLPVEAHITAGLSHVNVVRTIAHAWRPLSSHVSASMSVWDSAGSALGPASCSDGETWLLLELCDRGTLQVGAPLPLVRAASSIRIAFLDQEQALDNHWKAYFDAESRRAVSKACSAAQPCFLFPCTKLPRDQQGIKSKLCELMTVWLPPHRMPS